MPLNRIDMVVWGVVFAVLCWCAHSIHCICGAIQSILDMFSSKDKVEKALCEHIIELQKDKEKLTDRVNKATEIIRRFLCLFPDFQAKSLGDLHILNTLSKAEAFLMGKRKGKEQERDKDHD